MMPTVVLGDIHGLIRLEGICKYSWGNRTRLIVKIKKKAMQKKINDLIYYKYAKQQF
jgi:hypothetical protein